MELTPQRTHGYLSATEGLVGREHFLKSRACTWSNAEPMLLSMQASGHASARPRTGGLRLLGSVGTDMLVMWDRGFHSFQMVTRTLAQGAHCLGRLPAQAHPQFVRRLADGSSLVSLLPGEYRERQAGVRTLVRLIEYTLTDPHLEGYGQPYRLITSLLDPETAPAVEIACASA
jgi:hypothetical protein